jgi:hypothetical protein
LSLRIARPLGADHIAVEARTMREWAGAPQTGFASLAAAQKILAFGMLS